MGYVVLRSKDLIGSAAKSCWRVWKARRDTAAVGHKVCIVSCVEAVFITLFTPLMSRLAVPWFNIVVANSGFDLPRGPSIPFYFPAQELR